MFPPASSTSPSHRYSGAGSTKNRPAEARITRAVFTPSHSVRRPARSALCPATGASSAISPPAMASTEPSGRPASGPNASEVMYTVNTNVVITALNAADPQSHRDQASTGTVSRRCGRVRPASAEEGEVMTLTVGTDRGPGADISVSGENRSSLRLRSAAGSASMVRSASMVPPAGSSIGGQPQKGATVMTTWRTRPTRQVQALREDLHAAGYTVDHLTELVGPEAIAAMAREQVVPAVRRARTLTDPAAVLARLFILGDQVTPAELATALPRSAGYAGELGLLTTTTGGTVQ